MGRVTLNSVHQNVALKTFSLFRKNNNNTGTSTSDSLTKEIAGVQLDQLAALSESTIYG